MKIRTVFQPDDEIELPDDDAASARAQGLVHDCTDACAHPRPDAAPAAPDRPEVRTEAPAKTDPDAGVEKQPSKNEPAADSPAPADQAPTTSKG